MLTKEQYIVYINTEEVPIQLYYNYYLENKPAHYNLIAENDFKQIFETFLVHGQSKMIQTAVGPRFIGMDNILNKIYKYYNKKFEDK